MFRCREDGEVWGSQVSVTCRGGGAGDGKNAKDGGGPWQGGERCADASDDQMHDIEGRHRKQNYLK
jgi:hypothetical protein